MGAISRIRVLGWDFWEFSLTEGSGCCDGQSSGKPSDKPEEEGSAPADTVVLSPVLAAYLWAVRFTREKTPPPRSSPTAANQSYLNHYLGDGGLCCLEMNEIPS